MKKQNLPDFVFKAEENIQDELVHVSNYVSNYFWRVFNDIGRKNHYVKLWKKSKNIPNTYTAKLRINIIEKNIIQVAFEILNICITLHSWTLLKKEGKPYKLSWGITVIDKTVPTSDFFKSFETLPIINKNVSELDIFTVFYSKLAIFLEKYPEAEFEFAFIRNFDLKKH